LQSDLREIEAAGLTLVAISYDPTDDLAKFAERRKITFPLLSDTGSRTISAYGLLNKEATGKAAGIPYPGTVIVDRAGVIRAKLFQEGYSSRHTTNELIKASEEIP
jgi:peroxiredoxin Q/BCP